MAFFYLDSTHFAEMKIIGLNFGAFFYFGFALRGCFSCNNQKITKEGAYMLKVSL